MRLLRPASSLDRRVCTFLAKELHDVSDRAADVTAIGAVDFVNVGQCGERWCCYESSRRLAIIRIIFEFGLTASASVRLSLRVIVSQFENVISPVTVGRRSEPADARCVLMTSIPGRLRRMRRADLWRIYLQAVYASPCRCGRGRQFCRRGGCLPRAVLAHVSQPEA
jgi:hypothetical protein